MWERQAKGLCRLQVYDELELRRVLDRQVCRLGTSEDPIHEVRRALAHVPEADPVRHQTSLFDEIPHPVDPGQPMFEGGLRQLRAVRIGEGAERGNDAVDAVL